MRAIGTGTLGLTFAANQSLPPNFSTGVMSLSYGGYCTMVPGDDGKNAKSCSCLNTKGKWYHDHSRKAVLTTLCEPQSLPWEFDGNPTACETKTVTQVVEPYNIPLSCCDRCKLVASKVNLIYWPNEHINQTKRAASHQGYPVTYSSSGIVSDGMTYVSPSVYVRYHSLYALTSCAGNGPDDRGGWGFWSSIGNHYPELVRGYRPEQLSTARCLYDNPADHRGLHYCLTEGDPRASKQACFQGSNLGWEALNVQELATPPPHSVIYERKKSCFAPDVGFSFETGDALRMFHSPTIAFPAEVTDIDDTWKSWAKGRCVGDYLGAPDPPQTLKAATRLAPATTKVADSPAQVVTTAAPGGLPDTPTAAATAIATPNPQVGDHVTSARASSVSSSISVEADPDKSTEQQPKAIPLVPTDPKAAFPEAGQPIADHNRGKADIPGGISNDDKTPDSPGYGSTSAASTMRILRDPMEPQQTADQAVADGHMSNDDQPYAGSTVQSASALSDNGIVHMTGGGIQFGSQILKPGDKATISNNLVDYRDPTQIIVGNSQTYHLSSVSSAQPFVLSGGSNQETPHTVSRNPEGNVMIDGVTLPASGGVSPVTISSQQYSLNVHGSTSSIIVGSGGNEKTYILPGPSNAFLVQAMTTAASDLPAVVTIPNGAHLTRATDSENSPAFILPDSETVSAGGPAKTLADGTVISVLPAGKGILIDGSTTLSLTPGMVDSSVFTSTANIVADKSQATSTRAEPALSNALTASLLSGKPEERTQSVSAGSVVPTSEMAFDGGATTTFKTARLELSMTILLILFLLT